MATGMEVMMILSWPSWVVAVVSCWAGVVTIRDLMYCASLFVFPFWDSFRSGATVSVSVLRSEGEGRVETKEAASSVLLMSTYGRV